MIKPTDFTGQEFIIGTDTFLRIQLGSNTQWYKQTFPGKFDLVEESDSLAHLQEVYEEYRKEYVVKYPIHMTKDQMRRIAYVILSAEDEGIGDETPEDLYDLFDNHIAID